jgi:hypothetical protein
LVCLTESPGFIFKLALFVMTSTVMQQVEDYLQQLLTAVVVAAADGCHLQGLHAELPVMRWW